MEALMLAQMWAPSEEQTRSMFQDHKQFIMVTQWTPPRNGGVLLKWARDCVETYLLPLASALAPIKTSSKVPEHAAHVLVELGMMAFIFYLEKGIFPELENKAQTLLALTGDFSLPPFTKCKVQEFIASLPLMRTRMAASSHMLIEHLQSSDMPDVDMESAMPYSAKATCLLQLLADINSDGIKKGIIFVNQIALLYTLADMCRCCPEKYRVGEVGGVSSMTDKARNKALDDFKRGKISLIVATNALEEGIDVADCEFVIRYNQFGTTKSHIQGSGRARARDPKLFYFENDGASEEVKANFLCNTARNDALALSLQARAVHHDSISQPGTQSDNLYPFHPPGESQVNWSKVNSVLS